MTGADVVDAAADERVVVFGSLPPAGRDLDLVAPSEAVARLARALSAARFSRRGTEFARFEGCTADVVELASVSSWGLSAGEERALFDEALALPGRASLARPAPHHALLILARRVAGDGRFDGKRRARVDAELTRDGGAWEEAGRRAMSWGATGALAILRKAYEEGRAPARTERVAAIAERLGRGGDPISLARARAAWRVLRPRPPGIVVSFSGVDGSGKSSQATALARTVHALGGRPTVLWTRLTFDRWIDVVAAPVKAALRARSSIRRSRPTTGAAAAGDADAARELRERNSLVALAWSTVVVFANALSRRRGVRRARRAGKVVICDRYTLDALAQLRHQYGAARSFRLQSAIAERLPPRPDLAFFLDVDPTTAWERKSDEFTAEALVRHAETYRAEAARLGVIRLDGSLPQEELCRRVAELVWRKLP